MQVFSFMHKRKDMQNFECFCLCGRRGCLLWRGKQKSECTFFSLGLLLLTPLLLLFNYSCPNSSCPCSSLPPPPAVSTLLSITMGPLYLFLDLTLPLLSPVIPLLPPLWSLSVCSLFPSLWFYFAHLFVLFIKFHLY